MSKTLVPWTRHWSSAYLEVNVDLWKGEVKVAEEQAHRVQGTPEWGNPGPQPLITEN